MWLWAGFNVNMFFTWPAGRNLLAQSQFLLALIQNVLIISAYQITTKRKVKCYV